MLTDVKCINLGNTFKNILYENNKVINFFYSF